MDIMQIVIEILGIDECTYSHCQKELPEIDGWYFWNPIRGGKSMIINRNGEKLVANSSVSFDRHLSDFISGRRN
jgi:hypothetical protein